MAMDSSECNGSGGSPKVELETKIAGELGSDKDLPKSDTITSPEKEENDAEGIGGPFVFVNEDSDDPSEKDLDLIEKSDLAAVGEDKDHPSQIKAGEEICVKEEAESENARDPAEGAPSEENSGAELGVKVEIESTDKGELSEKVGKESTENGEVEEKVEKESIENGEIEEKVEEESAENGELGEKVEEESKENGELSEITESKTELRESEKKDSSEEVVLEKGDEKEGFSEEATTLQEIVAEKSEEKSGGEAERELAPSEKLEKESDLGVKETDSEVKAETDVVAEPKAESGVVVPVTESVVEESGAQLISESAAENGEKEEEVAEAEDQKDEKPEQLKEESDSASNVQELILEEVKDERKEEVSECLEGEKEEMEAPETGSAAEAVVESAVEAEKKQENKTVVVKSRRWADEEEPEEIVASDDHAENGHEESEPVPVPVEDKPQELASESEPVASNNVEETQAETEDAETVTDEPSQTQEVEEIQKPEADAEGDINNSEETDASKHDAESSNEVKVESEGICTDETDTVENVAESSDEVKVESVNKCTERDIDLSEAKTEVAPQQQHVDESVQIGNFTINIGENGPACLNEEVQPVLVSESSVAVPAPQEAGTSTAQGEKAVDSQIQSKRIFFMMKVPRYSDEEQLVKIRDAQGHLDDLTRKRDAIRQLIHKKRILNKDSWDEVQKGREEERAARAVFNAKRHEISSVQAVINKLNKANSIDDMDDLIDAKEKSMQHETMSLKQEKMLLQEIKELKSKRKQLVENMGSAAEIDEAFDQRDSVYDKIRTLKTELDVVGKTLAKAEEKTRELQRKYDETERSLCDSQDAHKAAIDVRENALLRWRQLKAQLAQKNKYFYGYMDDRTARGKYIVPTLDPEGLDSYCNNQVEKVMEMWNKDDGFRKQYIEMNKVSTIRRLGCLDGRALAPDEAPTVLPPPSTSYNRTATSLPTTTQLNLQKTSRVSSSNSVVDKMKDLQFPALPQIKPKPTTNKNENKSKASSSKDPAAAAAEREAETERVREAEEEKERKKRDEEERGRLREDEIRRKAKAEAQEKERLREEQKAKAKEAEERKKRKAEKAQERAEQFKARKEAEIRDKKRTKKDKKKAGSEVDSDDTSEINGSESATREISTTAAPSVAAPGVARRPVRPQVAMKQLKRVEPVPVALRNRNKKKMRTWLIGIATAVAAILTVFLIGNYVSWSDISSLFYA